MKGNIIPSIDYRDADLSGRSFTDCTFWKGSFAKAKLRGAELSNVTFDGVDLSLVELMNTALKEVRFKKCKLIGVDFRKCNPFLFNVSFEDCLVDTCNFSQLKLADTVFKNCVVPSSVFVAADLQRADFGGSDLSDSVFHDADARRANFVGARHYAIDPSSTKIKGARFSLPEAVSLLGAFEIELER